MSAYLVYAVGLARPAADTVGKGWMPARYVTAWYELLLDALLFVCGKERYGLHHFHTPYCFGLYFTWQFDIENLEGLLIYWGCSACVNAYCRVVVDEDYRHGVRRGVVDEAVYILMGYEPLADDFPLCCSAATSVYAHDSVVLELSQIVYKR